jgi:hypothetical protein
VKEAYEVRIDGDTLTPEYVDSPVFNDLHDAILEAEIEVARREFRAPHRLPWAPTPYGWITSNGRAKIVRTHA